MTSFSPATVKLCMCHLPIPYLTSRTEGLIYDTSVRARVESLLDRKAGHLHKLEIILTRKDYNAVD